MKSHFPIGVFDSGLGGLTVVKELMRQLPYENIVYFGDTARVPYGTKSKESIIRFSKENVAFLLKHDVKMIVVACNTSSSVALPLIAKNFRLPILGVIEPGARKAAQMTKTKNVGVIATQATINSEAYTKSLKKLNRKIKVISQACPLFVPLVEEGWTNHGVTHLVGREYLKMMKRSRVDTLILGCTHYPLLKNVIQKILGPRVTLVDSPKEVAKEARQILRENRIENHFLAKTEHLFFVSDEPKHFQKLARRFLGYDIKGVRRA